MWLRSFSTTTCGTPSAAMPDEKVRRSSCSAQSDTPHSTSNAAFGLPHPLKMVAGFPRTLSHAAGKTYGLYLSRETRLRTYLAAMANGKVCYRRYLVGVVGTTEVGRVGK